MIKGLVNHRTNLLVSDKKSSLTCAFVDVTGAMRLTHPVVATAILLQLQFIDTPSKFSGRSLQVQ